jgi:hypothetical protein
MTPNAFLTQNPRCRSSIFGNIQEQTKNIVDGERLPLPERELLAG